MSDTAVNNAIVYEEDLAHVLEGVEYPATKREILDVAIDSGAPDHILEFLNTMKDHEYDDFNSLVESLGVRDRARIII